MDRKLVAAALVAALCLPVYSETITVRRTRVGGGGGGCATQHYDVELPTIPGTDEITDLKVRGQSFVFTEGGDLYSIDVSFYQLYDASVDVEFRFSLPNDSDMESSYAAQIFASITSTGWHSFVFASPIEVSAGPTYYWAIKSIDNGTTYIGSEAADVYAGGNRMANNSGSFGVGNQTLDISMRAALCDP